MAEKKLIEFYDPQGKHVATVMVDFKTAIKRIRDATDPKTIRKVTKFIEKLPLPRDLNGLAEYKKKNAEWISEESGIELEKVETVLDLLFMEIFKQQSKAIHGKKMLLF